MRRIAAVLAFSGIAVTAAAQAPPGPAVRQPRAQPPEARMQAPEEAAEEETSPQAGTETGDADVYAAGAGGAVAAVPGLGQPFAITRVACDEVRFVWPSLSGGTGGFGAPESVVVVKNEVGNTGIRFIVDRATGETVGIQTWRELAGTTMTTIPGAARVDWIGCQDADPIGGIVVEWVDVRSLVPPAR